MTTQDERINTLEERVAWLQRLTDDLSAQLAAQDRRVMDLEAKLERMGQSVRAMAQERAPEVIGAMPQDDPVPNSG